MFVLDDLSTVEHRQQEEKNIMGGSLLDTGRGQVEAHSADQKGLFREVEAC
jgi:hypothetical protein